MTLDAPSRIKSHGNDCQQETFHNVLASRTREWVEEYGGQLVWHEKVIYDFVQCCGCENVSLRCTYTSLAEQGPTVDYFPPAVSRRLPKWLTSSGFIIVGKTLSDINELFREVYSSMFSGNCRVALMGARAIVDLALTDKLGDIGGFEKKIDEAQKRGWITSRHGKTLATTIDAGNAATHRAYKPEPKELDLVLNIIEHLIQLLYFLEPNARSIAEQTPKRSSSENESG